MIDVLAFIGIFFWLTAVVALYRIHRRMNCPWWLMPMILVTPFVAAVLMLLDVTPEIHHHDH